jgi:TonB family protein
VVNFELRSDTIIDMYLESVPEMTQEIVVKGYIVPIIERNNQPYTFKKIVPKNCDLDTIQRAGLLTPMEAREYLFEYLKYPAYSIAEENQGKVYVLVSIDSTGNFTDVQIKKGVSDCLDNMAKSAFLTMPKMIMKKKQVNGRYNEYATHESEEGEYIFPISFVLD